MSTAQLDAPPARRSSVPATLERARRLADRGRALGVRALAAFDRHRRPEPEVDPYVAGVTPVWRLLFRPALLGFIASAAILFGASQPSSPFTFKHAGAWYFGIPGVTPQSSAYTPAPGQWLFVGVVAVYGGMLLLLRAWYDIVKITSRHRGIPVARLVPVFIAWVLPLLVVAPLFSKDVYSYAAQGEMVSRGINPYHYGPALLGAGSAFNRLVDPLWQQVSSPYGPVFLKAAGLIVLATGHNVLETVVGMRALALIGTVMFAAAIPTIARSYNRDGSTAFALAALNPLILLHLVAGAHNDALMIGFMAVGFALARRGHRLIGVVLCGIAAAVKIPGIIGALYIGWDWLGTGRPVRERLRPTATALIVALGVMAALSEVVGLGWGWIGGLQNPDTVRSWLDPATGIGLFLGHLGSMIGVGRHTHVLLTICRGTAMLLAGVIGVRLLLRSDEIGALKAMGWTLVAIVVLGPTVQPWYAAWGFVFLAPVVEGRVRSVLIWISGIACFVGLPGGRVLVDELGVANPAIVAGASAVLVALAVYMVLPRFRQHPAHRELTTGRV